MTDAKGFSDEHGATAALVLMKWTFVSLAFFWWRRHRAAVLAQARKRVEEE